MALTKAQVTAELWKRADLRYKLKPVQRLILSAITLCKSFKFVIECSRRLGKSYLLCVLSVETCLKKPFAQVRYAAPTNKALKKIVLPILRKILLDAPEHLRPEWKQQDGMFLFPNGSELHLAGVNNGNAENLRGTACDLFIVDEAGTVDELLYLIKDIALPQFLDPDGEVIRDRILLISGTPARSPAHEFTEVCEEAELLGNYAHYTIYDAGYAEATIAEFMTESGGEESSTWQREYLAKRIVDKDYAIIPEWKPEYVGEPDRDEPAHYLWHRYVGMDIGVRDLTVMLYGHYNFVRGKLFVEDETWMYGPKMTTQTIVDSVKAKEKELWGPLKPYRRISDNNNLVLINDLSIIHDLSFIPTDKEALEAMVNAVRLMVQQGRIVVSPKCTQLIGCLSYGVWDERRKEFDRSKAFGHFDALAALVYLVRNLDKASNPVPEHFGKDLTNSFYKKTQQLSDGAAAIKSVFKGLR